MMWLKLVIPVLLVIFLWWWNRRRQEVILEKELKEHEEETPCYMFSGGMTPDIFSSLMCSDLEGIKDLIRGGRIDVKNEVLKVYRVMKGDQIIAAVIFSWPSGLWSFRKDRGETELGSYSHIFGIEVSERYRKTGYFYKLMDLVISDTYRISSGVTIDLPKEQEVVDLFKRKFEFKPENKIMKLEYENWS